MNYPPFRSFRRSQRGFNMIEMMIGITISLFGLAAVSGIMLTFSGKRSSIAGTLAAQDSGVMALYRIERDLSQAGYGMLHLQTCATLDDATASFAPFPFLIGDGGATASDTIIVQYSNSRGGSPGTELSADSGGQTMTTSQYNILSASGFMVGDRVVSSAAAPGACKITTVTETRKCSMTSAGPPKAYSCTTSTYSAGPPVTTLTSTDTPTGSKPQEWIGHATTGVTASSTAGYLANLGQSGEFLRREYLVNGGALKLREYTNSAIDGLSTANVLVNDIVFMKAQYGLATTSWSGTACTRADDTVTSWVNGTQSINEQNACGVIAARVGLVARTSNTETIDSSGTTALEVLPAITAGSTTTAAVTYDPGSDRNRYRYRVYSTTIPLKNVIWSR